MGTLTPIAVDSGRSTRHRESFAQPSADLVVFSNGHDPLSVFNLRNKTKYAYGMAAPVAPTAGASPGAGNVKGNILYRARWYDDTLQTYSLGSAVLEQTVDSIQVRINRPGSIPSRATHWIVERTVNGGDTFYPVATVAIGTATYDDNLTDADLEAFRDLALQDNQGQPEFIPRGLFSNQGILHGFGGRIHRVTATVTNGSPNVTLGSEFTQQMATEKQDLTVPADADGNVYKVSTYSSATAIGLASNYSGTTGSKTISIAPRRDRVWWAEGDNPEHGGVMRGGICRNQAFLGDDGEPVVGGCGLGPVGVLYAKESYLYFHRYNTAPNASPAGDGIISKLQSRRGTIGPMALRCINGVVYSIDKYGIWRASPGGEPQEMAGDLAKLWKDNTLEFTTGDNWHIAWDPFHSWVIFFMCLDGETYPTQGWVFDLKLNQWRGTLKFPLGVTCTAELPDANGALRMAFWLQKHSTGAPSYHYLFGTTYTQGSDPSTTVRAVCTSGGATSVTCAAANFKTTNAACKGLQVRKRTVAGVEETQICYSNSGTQLLTGSWGVTPVPDDIIIVGGIESKWRSGRIFGGEPLRRKKFLGVWVTLAASPAARSLYLKAYYNGNSTAANNPAAKTNDGDGVTQASGSPVTTIACAGQTTARRVYIPLHGPNTGSTPDRWATDIELELYSNEPDATAWEVMELELEFEVEDGARPSKDAA